MKYLVPIFAVSLMIPNASAQVVKNPSSCSYAPIDCDRKYGDAGWAFDQKTCAQLKADQEKLYKDCKEAESKKPLPEAEKAARDQLKKQQDVSEINRQAQEGTDKGVAVRQTKPIKELFTDSLSDELRENGYTTGEVGSLTETTIKKVSDAASEAQAFAMASKENSTAGPSQKCSNGKSYCGDYPEHPPLTPKEVFQLNETNELNAQMEQYTNALVKQYKDQAAAEAAANEAVRARPSHDFSHHPADQGPTIEDSYGCPTCDGSGPNPNQPPHP